MVLAILQSALVVSLWVVVMVLMAGGDGAKCGGYS